MGCPSLKVAQPGSKVAQPGSKVAQPGSEPIANPYKQRKSMFFGLELKEYAVLEKPHLVLEETTAGFGENKGRFLTKPVLVSFNYKL